MRNNSFYLRHVKRLLDILCAMTAIIVFSWLYVIIAVLVRLKLGRPVIFMQKRAGRINPLTGKEKIFTLYKFRTMTDERDENGELLPDEVRLTGFGRFLRSTSLDELPEAWNILKGDMSVVGPRPLLVKYLNRYTEHQRRRHEVNPGLSGYAQVHGRNLLSWEERFDMDVLYVDNVSFFMDLKLVIKTVAVVLNRAGITSDTCETMEEFMGTEEELEK